MLGWGAVISKNSRLDLLLAVLLMGAAWLLVAVFPGTQGWWRIILGLFVLLVVPGYMVTLALFPGRAALNGLDRTVLSIGYSLVAVPLVGLLLNATPWGITAPSMAGGLSLLTAALAGVVWLQRRSRPAGQTFLVGHSPAGLRRVSTFVLVIAAALVGLWALSGRLRADVPLTEFYLLGPQGRLGDYPVRVGPRTDLALTLAVRNLERQPTAYRIRPSLCRDIVQVPPLAPGQEWRGDWTCRPGRLTGEAALRFDLYREGDEGPYRTLELRLNP